MALFHLMALDKANALELRMANRPAHLEWAGDYSGQIKMAGPVLSEDGETLKGSVFVVDMESIEAVRNWHANDPYVQAGLFERVEVYPFKWLLGAGPN